MGIKPLRDIRTDRLNVKKLVGYTPTLRKPQAIALERVKENDCGLVRMATGVGKTALGQEIIRYHGVPALFLVPSKPILEQTVERFKEAFGRRNVGKFGDGKKTHGHITVATYQSVYRAKPEEFDRYQLALFDEVHHIAAETFFEVGLRKLRKIRFRYGLTADEERADGGTLLVHAATGPVIYSYSAAEAIRDGYLAKPTFQIYDIYSTHGTFIDWKMEGKKRVAKGIIQAEEFRIDDHFLAYKHWVLGNDRLTATIAQMITALNDSGKSVLVLVNEKEHGEKFMDLLPEDQCKFVYGGGKENKKWQDSFNERGTVKTLIGTSTIGEGADTVPVDYLFNLMGGRFPKQANGRALRNETDKNGIPQKPTCVIVDFDFPLNPALHRHAGDRLKVHSTYTNEEIERKILI